MKRPRCGHCESAMKTPYERKGSNAQFTSIDRWWYCGNCGNMQLGPQVPETDPKRYLHPEAATIYPEISPYVKNDIDRSAYQYLNELKEAAEKWDDELLSLHSEVYQYLKPEFVDKRSREVLEPIFICSECGSTEPIPNGTGEEGLEAKKHSCGAQMKISVRPRQEPQSLLLLENLQEKFHQHRGNGESEEAGTVLLDITLHHLQQIRGIYFNGKAFELYNIVSKKYSNQLSQTWGYKTTKSLAQCFSQLGNGGKGGEYFGHSGQVVKEYNVRDYSLDMVNEVFRDIITRLTQTDPDMVPSYRIRFNIITKSLLNTYRGREKMEELFRIQQQR